MSIKDIPNLENLPAGAFLTMQQLTALTGFSAPTFRLWRLQGRGPAAVKLEGRLRYKVSDVRAWLESANG